MDGSRAGPWTKPLSTREAQVLELVAAGRSNKAIARELGLSLHTVKRHVVRTLVKLKVASRSEAASLFRHSSVAPCAGDDVAAVGDGQRDFTQLTGREREVLALVASGASNHRIASDLNLRTSTVKWHTSNIFDKLGVHSRIRAGALVQDAA